MVPVCQNCCDVCLEKCSTITFQRPQVVLVLTSRVRAGASTPGNVSYRLEVKANVRSYSEKHIYRSIFLSMHCSSAMLLPCLSLNL